MRYTGQTREKSDEKELKPVTLGTDSDIEGSEKDGMLILFSKNTSRAPSGSSEKIKFFTSDSTVHGTLDA